MSPAPQRAIEHINPEGLHRSPAFTQVVAVSGPAKTMYIGLQLAVDKNGQIVGKGDIVAQTKQVLNNIALCLEATGATPEHLVIWSIYLAAGQELQKAAAAGIEWWGNRPHPPANNVMFVPGFSDNPDFLIGIEAVAVVPEGEPHQGQPG